MSDPKVYPITHEFETFARNALKPLGPIANATARYSLWDIYKNLKETLGEYEHGSADVDTMFDKYMVEAGIKLPDEGNPRNEEVTRKYKLMCLKIYEAILEDTLLVFLNQIQ